MTNKKNTHSPPSKRQVKIAKLQQKITARLRQRNTDKRDRDVAKWQTRIKKLESNVSLGTKGKLRQEIKSYSQRVKSPFLSDSARDYLVRKKEEDVKKLRKLEAGQKRGQRLKKLLKEGLFPGQKKRISEVEKKRKYGYRQYVKKAHYQKETYLKSLFQDIFGKKEGKEKFSVALKRREKYKGKSGWFSKWVRRTERNLFRARKSKKKSEEKKLLRNLSKMSGERVKKKSRSQSWNRWVETETKRLEKAVENKQKIEEGKKWQVIIDKERKKEEADTWSIYDRATNSKKDKGQWYWNKYRVINDYTGEIGVWEEGYKYVFNFNKMPISGLVIDYDSNTIWTERLW